MRQRSFLNDPAAPFPFTVCSLIWIPMAARAKSSESTRRSSMPDNSDLFGVGGGAAARKPIPKPNMAAPGDTAAQRSGAVAPPARKGASGEPPVKTTPGEAGYDASTIEVLEGLEPV